MSMLPDQRISRQTILNQGITRLSGKEVSPQNQLWLIPSVIGLTTTPQTDAHIYLMVPDGRFLLRRETKEIKGNRVFKVKRERRVILERMEQQEVTEPQSPGKEALILLLITQASIGLTMTTQMDAHTFTMEQTGHFLQPGELRESKARQEYKAKLEPRGRRVKLELREPQVLPEQQELMECLSSGSEALQQSRRIQKG